MNHENQYPEREPEGHDFIYWPDWGILAQFGFWAAVTAVLADAAGMIDLNVWAFAVEAFPCAS